MKRLFGLFLAGIILAGCQTAGGIAQTVGSKFTDYSNKQDDGIVKTATGAAGSAYTSVGNAVAPKKAEAAKTPVAKDSTAPAPVTKTATKKTAPKVQPVKAGGEAAPSTANKTGM